MFNQYRRHGKGCRFGKEAGRDNTRCSCPIHYDGYVDGKRVRDSLHTRDWARAATKLRGIEEQWTSGVRKDKKAISEAAKAFLLAGEELAIGTKTNRRIAVSKFAEYAASVGVTKVEELQLQVFYDYRGVRSISARTWVKELSILKHFMKFCFSRKWTDGSFIHDLKAKRPEDNEKVPYSEEEIISMLKACDRLGNGPYERLRAKACVMLLRFTALRISDIATLERARIVEDSIQVYTRKKKKPVFLPLPHEVVEALKSLPIPRGGDKGYFFWSGNGTLRALDRDFSRTLRRVFKLSEVPGAHAHRFRHTLATRLLEKGWTFDDVALVLGNSPGVVRKHYGQWSKLRQDRVTEMMKGLQESAKEPEKASNWAQAQNERVM